MFSFLSLSFSFSPPPSISHSHCLCFSWLFSASFSVFPLFFSFFSIYIDYLYLPYPSTFIPQRCVLSPLNHPRSIPSSVFSLPLRPARDICRHASPALPSRFLRVVVIFPPRDSGVVSSLDKGDACPKEPDPVVVVVVGTWEQKLPASSRLMLILLGFTLDFDAPWPLVF